MSRVITCQDCGEDFTGNGRSLRCPACSLEYRRAQARERYTPVRREDRKKKTLSFDAAWLYSQITPGMTKSAVTRLLGWRESNVEGLLATLEYHGFLLSEDNGRIYPFGRTA